MAVNHTDTSISVSLRTAALTQATHRSEGACFAARVCVLNHFLGALKLPCRSSSERNGGS